MDFAVLIDGGHRHERLVREEPGAPLPVYTLIRLE